MVNGVAVRRATRRDADAISAIIEAADLNRLDLDWRRFFVAAEGDVVLGTAQVRILPRGNHDLASVAVVASHRGRGLGTLVAEAAIAADPVRPLWLTTGTDHVTFWQRLGFVLVDQSEMPADLRDELAIAQELVSRLPGRVAAVVMRRDAR